MIPHSRPTLPPQALSAVQNALRATRLSQGPEVKKLEAQLETLYPDCSAVCVASGTAALYLALQALHLPAGAELILPSYTCNALYAAAAHAGLKPVCADIGPAIPVLTPESVQAVRTPQTAAVILPHTFGFYADAEAVRQATGLPVIEDCAQALGIHQQPGTAFQGELAVLSFFATKLIPGCEGGAVMVRNPETAAELRRLRDCDEAAPDPRAFNFKMSDLHAALIGSTLQQLNQTIAVRNTLAETFDRELSTGPLPGRATHQPVCFRYVLHHPALEADALGEAFEARGIQARRPIWQPLHTTLGGTCPETEHRHRHLISLPLYPALTATERAHIIRTAKELFDAAH
jgi:dTDP-4-amino-4,6-dideoxygalactose transaminase